MDAAEIRALASVGVAWCTEDQFDKLCRLALQALGDTLYPDDEVTPVRVAVDVELPDE